MAEDMDMNNTVVSSGEPAAKQAVDATPGALKVSCHSCRQKIDVSDLEPFSQFSYFFNLCAASARHDQGIA